MTCRQLSNSAHRNTLKISKAPNKLKLFPPLRRLQGLRDLPGLQCPRLRCVFVLDLYFPMNVKKTKLFTIPTWTIMDCSLLKLQMVNTWSSLALTKYSARELCKKTSMVSLKTAFQMSWKGSTLPSLLMDRQGQARLTQCLVPIGMTTAEATKTLLEGSDLMEISIGSWETKRNLESFQDQSSKYLLNLRWKYKKEWMLRWKVKVTIPILDLQFIAHFCKFTMRSCTTCFKTEIRADL